jgi:hypothetical protein
MSDKTILNEHSLVSHKVISQCEGQPAPEFKPGNTPSMKFGNETLNGNVVWEDVVQDLLAQNYTMAQIADTAEVKVSVIKNVLNHLYEGLSFRAGARILGLHYKLHPGLDDCHG